MTLICDMFRPGLGWNKRIGEVYMLSETQNGQGAAWHICAHMKGSL